MGSPCCIFPAVDAAFLRLGHGCLALQSSDCHPTLHPFALQLPLLSPEPAALQHALASGPDPQEEVQCRLFLSLCQVGVGIVAPTLLLAKLQAPAEAAAALPAAADSTEQRRGRRRQSDRQDAARDGSRCSSGSPVKRVSSLCVRLLRSAAEEAEATLWHLCQLLTNRAGSLLVTALAWWLLLSVVWVSVLLLELPRLLLGL